MDVQTARRAGSILPLSSEGARAREELLAVALVREVRGGLLEDDEVKREGVAQQRRRGPCECGLSPYGSRPAGALRPVGRNAARGRVENTPRRRPLDPYIVGSISPRSF